MKTSLIIVILLTLSTYDLYAQNRTIKGRVIDELLQTMPYTSIMINDTVNIGKTDLDGFFEVEIPVAVKKVSLASVGFDPTIIGLTDNCNEIEVVMMMMGTYDFVTLKRVDKLRMKRFKMLPELHKQAFEKGLFKTEKACYTEEFVPFYYKKKQK